MCVVVFLSDKCYGKFFFNFTTITTTSVSPTQLRCSVLLKNYALKISFKQFQSTLFDCGNAFKCRVFRTVSNKWFECFKPCLFHAADLKTTHCINTLNCNRFVAIKGIHLCSDDDMRFLASRKMVFNGSISFWNLFFCFISFHKFSVRNH